MTKVKFIVLLLLLAVCRPLFSQSIKVGAELMDKYLPLLAGKAVAVVANPTSCVGTTHLVDTLLARGVNIKSIFCPEHGFRGQAEAGASVANETDVSTGLPIFSLYGKNKKPTADRLEGIDIVIFDLQDVGARFYTYISTLHYVMEAVAENGLQLLVLDRPNPNGFYVDGPVLDLSHRSFVGMHPVPIVHGMTIGEYALMINAEGWLEGGISCNMTVITMQHYTHDSLYILPIAPSPNLKTPNAIYLYPSLCCFEGTTVSVGRGTDMPFEVIGSPQYSCTGGKVFSFVPKPIKGASLNPMHNGEQCKGMDLRGRGVEIVANRKLDLSYLRAMYACVGGDKFFNSFFEKLMGTAELRKQIMAGATDEDIRASWQPGLDAFKLIRKKYLLYPDFSDSTK